MSLFKVIRLVYSLFAAVIWDIIESLMYGIKPLEGLDVSLAILVYASLIFERFLWIYVILFIYDLLEESVERG